MTGKASSSFFVAGIITILNFVLPCARAHFSVLVPDSPAVRAGQEVTIRHYVGHPYECQIVDTREPEKVEVLLPDGQTRIDLRPEPEQVDNFEGGTVTIQTMRFTPSRRGDHLVLLKTPMRFDEHAGGFVQDEVKLILRVQVHQGWDNRADTPIELLPLTRPYGLEPGMAFKARAVLHGKPLVDAEVEIEKYHARPPERIPEDEALITRVVKTDVNGYIVVTLTEPGWWALNVQAEDGAKEKDGKRWPLIRRAQFWLYVSEKTN